MNDITTRIIESNKSTHSGTGAQTLNVGVTLVESTARLHGEEKRSTDGL